VQLIRTAQSFRALREGRTWRLLATRTAPAVLAMLRCLFEEEKTLAASVLQERVTNYLELLRGEAYYGLSQSPGSYISEWLSEGWLERRLPTGASEEVYEMTSEAHGALRYAQSLVSPRTTATESRLANVMQQLVRLAEETDTNPESRMRALLAERERIDAQIDALQRHGAVVLSEERALERAREVIALAQELAADFRNVRDAFGELNRELRKSLLDDDGSRGEVLGRLFEGVDVIAESEHGRTFNAFWRLLTDGEQSALFAQALDAVTEREFAQKLDARERRFLHNLTATLLSEGNEVNGVLQQFARSLKSFVQSREFQEQRRIRDLLREAQQAALALLETVNPREKIDFKLTLTSAPIRSVSQWLLYDPQMRAPVADMTDAPPAELGLDVVQGLVKESEIDLRTLKDHIRAALSERSQVRVGELLERFPAEQGFGSVVGYIALGARHGEVTDAHEIVHWSGTDGVPRAARVAAIYFTQRSLDALVD
jgi:hypothetical protein